MKYCETSLANIISRKQYVDEQVLKKWILDLANGLDFLHKNNIVHPCLNPKNIFVVHNNLLISDYSPNRDYFDIKNNPNKNGQKRKINTYIPPEKYKGENVTEKSNLWSLGCIIYELLYNHPPYNFDSDVVQMKAVCNNPIPDELFCCGENVLTEIIELLLRKDPKQRYILRTIINHPYIINSIIIIYRTIIKN